MWNIIRARLRQEQDLRPQQLRHLRQRQQRPRPLPLHQGQTRHLRIPLVLLSIKVRKFPTLLFCKKIPLFGRTLSPLFRPNVMSVLYQCVASCPSLGTFVTELIACTNLEKPGRSGLLLLAQREQFPDKEEEEEGTENICLSLPFPILTASR